MGCRMLRGVVDCGGEEAVYLGEGDMLFAMRCLRAAFRSSGVMVDILLSCLTLFEFKVERDSYKLGEKPITESTAGLKLFTGSQIHP